MRFLSYLVTLLFASLVAACGGGGGSPGTITGPQALAVNAPVGLIQLVGTAQSFAITGGKGPFQALSNNELVAIAGVTDGTLTIGTVGVGTATITVRDAFGATVNVPLTSAVAQPLSTTAGSAITLPIGATQSFRVVGGAPGYTATSANPNIASASILGGTLNVTGITPGSTSVLVQDGVGATVNISVTVTTAGNLALFTTAPSPVSVTLGSAAQSFSVGGGVPASSGPAYSVTSNNTAVAIATLNGNTLSITPVSVGTAVITIRDSVAGSISFTVNVLSPGTVFTTAPSAGVTISSGSFAQFDIGGGLPPYTPSSSNSAVANATLVGTTAVKIAGGTAGSATVQVRDSLGSIATIAVTVPGAGTGTAFFTTAPASIIMANGSTQTFTLSGGTSPYSAVTDNTTVASVTQPTASTFTIQAQSAGAATITLRDSAGATKTVGVTVSAGSTVPLSTTAPSTVSIAASTTQTYPVTGGTGTYTITNTNPFNASATLSAGAAGPAGGTLTVKGLLVGTTTLTLRDAAGGLVTITVNVIQPGTTLQLLPSSLTVSESTATFSIDLSVFGGTPPYTAFTSNLSLTSATIVPGATTKLHIGGGTAATECVAATTAVTLTVLDSLGASATSTLNIVDLNAGAGCPP